ncbi:ABC transporter substrate-binding protein [Pelagibius litoralis]|uniref:ABC transporter substrate-binding protein n=1 Tax=Pelagibius litoralis TaxID=374515 RepID=A0A967EYQ0_9PROT|nr:ABC transporter substrate-binding protein [Pelagibius litoralis]NIA69857.1 ABC transporter substrate-binding protein [Pelagibius litoralis]
MRFGSLLSSLSLALLTATTVQVAAVQAADVVVATTAIVEHPALDAARDGVRDELAAAGYVEGENLRFLYESAQGNPATAAQIARKFVGEAPDVIVPISTPSAQAVVSATKDIPVVFSAVTDPVGAKLVGDPMKPGGNVTGMSDLSPIGKHLDLIKQITPDAKSVGVMFNPGEANSLSLLELIKQEAPARGLSVVEGPATKTSEVLGAAQSLVGKADVIYVPTDNTIISAFEAVVKVGIDNKIPVYAGDTDSVPRGAVAALGFNYYDVGRQTGKMVVRILKGEAPGDIAVEGVDITELYVNPGMAEKMGVTIPEALIQQAKEVVR